MKSFLKVIIPLAIIVFLLLTIWKNWILIQEKILSANYSLLALALLVLALGQLGGAFLWKKILSINFVKKIGFKEILRIFVVSNFGRFIPGVILHYIARVYLSKKIGIAASQATLSVFLEAYYTFLGGLVVSFFALPVLIKYFNLSWLFLFLLIFAVLLPPAKLFQILQKIPYLKSKVHNGSINESMQQHIFLICWSSFLFLSNGFAFFLIASAFTKTSLIDIFLMSGVFASSWIIGFLTPVAPGGLGVSDLSFALLLSSLYNFYLSSFLALVLRIGFLLSEGIVFLLVIKLSGWDIINPRQKEK